MSASNGSLKGRVALVTGGHSGIGKEIVKGLAKLGAEVIIGARSVARAQPARDELAAETGNPAISIEPLDVSSMESIRAFAKKMKSGGRKLNIVINNAGAWFTDRRDSPEGIELTLATNVLGPYLLNEELTDLLRANAPARILNVVSTFASDFDVTDLEFRKRKYDGFKAYNQSKQALRMLSWGLAARLQGSGITVNAVEPGFVRSALNRNAHGFVPTMINLSARLFAQSPAKGADTAIWAASAPELEKTTNKFFGGRKERECKFRDPAAIAALEKACAERAAKA